MWLIADDSHYHWYDLHMSHVSLAAMRKGARGVVTAIADDRQSVGDSARSTVSRRLLELGFCPGERVEVVEEIWPGGDPMAVRIGRSVFALRRREAAAVTVALEDGESG
jgi:Fe2+ transport system protein FeoA